MNDANDNVTIAKAVIAYRNELRDAGIAIEYVNEMVRDAASRLVQSQGASAIMSLATIE